MHWGPFFSLRSYRNTEAIKDGMFQFIEAKNLDMTKDTIKIIDKHSI